MQTFVHVAHVVLGVGASLAGIIALGVGKGSRWHRWAGWIFVGGMLLAAITTYIFMLDEIQPGAANG